MDMNFGSIADWVSILLALTGVAVIRQKSNQIYQAILRSTFWKTFVVVAALVIVLMAFPQNRERMRHICIKILDQKSPEFAVRAYDRAKDKEAICVICLVEDWESPKEPGHKSWLVDFPANKPALIRMGWCAVDQATLENNLSRLEYELFIDEYEVDLNQLTVHPIRSENGVCRIYSGVLTGWSIGFHSYMMKRHIHRELNDGRDTYETGEYLMEFIVKVR